MIELYRQGTAAREVYFIESGLVKLIRSEQGGQELITDLRFPGYLLADASIIANRPHPLTAVTLTKTRVRRIPAKVFCRLLQGDAQFAWGIRQMQSREAFDNVARITQLGCLSARLRLEHLIRMLIRAEDVKSLRANVRLEVPLKSWEVAQLIAVTPAYLSRLFNQLEKDEILKRRAGWVIIPDPQKLWRWSE
ncbi:MAG TPA: Crp/Fnr family transcriptional regulator [Pyrinomonadaceae bacterium]|jgi:CRP-like cAMP-binding protein|nr:Crp/Fnr family transcriptional regulator [Pyrinomonadaceae bacterium]